MSERMTFVEALFDALEFRGVRYCVLRNWSELPLNLKGSDIDLVVDPDDFLQFDDIIAAASARSNVRILGQARLRPDFARYFLVGANTAGDSCGVSVDVFLGVYYKGGCELATIESLLGNAERHNGVQVLRDEVAVLLAIVKEALHNVDIPIKYVHRAREFADESRDLALSAFIPFTPRTRRLLKMALELDGGSERRRLLRTLRYSVLWASFARRPFFFLAGLARNYWSIVRRLTQPPGKVVAILGVDGAGKSTNIAAVAPLLREASHGDCAIQHLRPRLLPPLSVLLSRSRGHSSVEVTTPHAQSVSGFSASVFRASYLLADYIIGYFLVVRPVICKSPAVFLFDRYAYDLELDPRRYRIGLPPKLIRFFTSLVPRPDLIICLYGDPSRIALRKGELPLAEVERQTAAIKAFAKDHANAVLVSTDVDVAQSSEEVLGLICGRVRRGKDKCSRTNQLGGI